MIVNCRFAENENEVWIWSTNICFYQKSNTLLSKRTLRSKYFRFNRPPFTFPSFLFFFTIFFLSWMEWLDWLDLIFCHTYIHIYTISFSFSFSFSLPELLAFLSLLLPIFFTPPLSLSLPHLRLLFPLFTTLFSYVCMYVCMSFLMTTRSFTGLCLCVTLPIRRAERCLGDYVTLQSRDGASERPVRDRRTVRVLAHREFPFVIRKELGKGWDFVANGRCQFMRFGCRDW